MRPIKILGITMALIFSVMSFPAYHVDAGKPPIAGRIVGPEVIGVAVLDFSKQVAVLRVKREIKGKVETRSLTTCTGFHHPRDESEVLYYRLDGVTLFGHPGTPIFTKIENFKREGDILSFDVRIQFWMDKKKK